MAFTRIGSRSVPRGQRVTVQFQGNMLLRMGRLISQGKNFQKPMSQVSQDLARSTDKNFIAQGRIDDAEGVWPKLAPSTLKRRRSGQKRGVLRILQDSGLLRESIAPFHGDFEAGVSTTVPYAGVHQQGGNFGAVTVIGVRTIPRHLRTMMVREDYSPLKALRRKRRQGPKRPRAPQVKKAKKRKSRKRHGPSLLRKRQVVVDAHVNKGGGRIPARPFLRIHNQDVERAIERITKWVLLKKNNKRGR
jgi:phage gpG-like protein